MPIDNYGAQYPGSPIYGQPPATGLPIYTPITPGPVTAHANYSNTTPAVPAVGTRTKSVNHVVPAPIGVAELGAPAPVPAIGVPNHTPLLTPLGTTPHYKTPNEIWEYDYGSGGDGMGVPGP